MIPLMNRRDVLRRLSGLAAMALAGRLEARVDARPSAAFEARSAREAIESLFPGVHAQAHPDLRIHAPEITDNGAVVPITVHADLPSITQLVVLAPENPRPLIAVLRPGKRLGGPIALRIKLAKSQQVEVIAVADGRFYNTSRAVRVTVSGCAGDSDGGDDGARAIGATRFKLDPPSGGSSGARFLINHPMLVERVAAESGKSRAAHYIEEIDCTVNGEALLTLDCGQGVSANPFVSFALRDPRPGEVVTIAWRDNRGMRGSNDFPVA
jgi:sulfur-oxidizing protein SoxY